MSGEKQTWSKKSTKDFDFEVISTTRSVNLRDWRRLSELNLIDRHVRAVSVDVIRIAVLLGGVDALPPTHHATTADAKYHRIVDDKVVEWASLGRVALDLLLDWLGVVTKARHRLDVHDDDDTSSLEVKLEQLRVGQFYGLYFFAPRALPRYAR